MRVIKGNSGTGARRATDENSGEICMASTFNTVGSWKPIRCPVPPDLSAWSIAGRVLWRTIPLRAYPLMVRGRSIEVHGAEMYSGLRQDLGMILEEAAS